jgi:hypothetical protein
MIHAEIDSNPINPGIESSRSPESFNGMISPDETLLSQVLGLIHIMHKAIGHHKDPLLIALHQDPKGLQIALLRKPDQLFVAKFHFVYSLDGVKIKKFNVDCGSLPAIGRPS